MPDDTKVEASQDFKDLVTQKRQAGLTREQAESVAKRQLQRDAEEAKKAKTAKKD